MHTGVRGGRGRVRFGGGWRVDPTWQGSDGRAGGGRLGPRGGGARGRPWLGTQGGKGGKREVGPRQEVGPGREGAFSIFPFSYELQILS
jgi:hypothetical protein